ncbi:hypothetical protein [Vibrio splendidus]|uniref:hypothetical protein n=1 Tax=Vibrio splendidus TaxID=29497 RepID=UPI000066FC34|nr:hypothetical protein [Vibrio splendidus]EAP95701.1 hypothetical protein V12B01_02895 [Vibrio splendidus 12B01]OCH63257.1 hypothetical protein A6D94_15710 [Vibrio splendidus]
MRIKILGLLLFSIPYIAHSASGYEVSVSIHDSEKELKFPPFEVPFFDQKVLFLVGDCTYSWVIRQESETTVLLEGLISCHYEEGGNHFKLPVFYFDRGGVVANMEFGEDSARMWKYSVEARRLN